MKNIKEYLKTEDIEFFLANTPQITFEVTDTCILKRLKFILLVLLLVGQIVAVQAQEYYLPFCLTDIDKYKTLDSAYLKVSYKLTYIKDTTESNSKYTDLEVLLIGKHTSKYFSQQFAEYNEYIIKPLLKLHKEAVPGAKSGTLGLEIFKDYNSNKLTVTDLVTRMHLSFLYKEDFPQITWTILNENQTISSYPCQKATTTFRGRKYEAWFTTKIPINNGPWKFGGLPGLILKISDTQNNYVFECMGIESLRIKEPIKFYTLEYKELKREDYNLIVKRFHKNTIAYYKAIGTWAGGDENKINQLPYNPIEKE
jgi:GLPGLI family protein